MGVAVRNTPLLRRSYQYTKFFSFDSNKNVSSCRSSKPRRAMRVSSSGLLVCAASPVSRLFREASSASYVSRFCSRKASRSRRENENRPSRGGNNSKKPRLRSRMRCVFRSSEGVPMCSSRSVWSVSRASSSNRKFEICRPKYSLATSSISCASSNTTAEYSGKMLPKSSCFNARSAKNK